jgi:hypothetical protein
MRADIDSDFYRAIENGISTEEELLRLKLDIFESLEWDDAAFDTADQLKAKGYEVEYYRTREAEEERIRSLRMKEKAQNEHK